MLGRPTLNDVWEALGVLQLATTEAPASDVRLALKVSEILGSLDEDTENLIAKALGIIA